MKIVIMLLMFMLSGTNGLFEKKEIETENNLDSLWYKLNYKIIIFW